MKVFPKEESWASFTSRYFKSDSRRSLNISAGIDTKDSDSDSVANNGDDFQEQSVRRAKHYPVDTDITRCTKHRLHFMTGSETNDREARPVEQFRSRPMRLSLSNTARWPKFFVPTRRLIRHFAQSYDLISENYGNCENA